MSNLRGVVMGVLAVWLFGAASTVLAQHRVLYLDPKNDGTVIPAIGAIVDESKKEVVVKPLTGDRVVIPGKSIIDIIYVPGKNDVAEEYKKAYEAEQKAAQAVGGDRKKSIEGAIDLYRGVLPKVENEASIKRHVQFRIITLTALLAAGDPSKLTTSIEALEKFLKDNPDSWQANAAERQLAIMKKKKK